jgi:hypothetical protein
MFIPHHHQSGKRIPGMILRLTVSTIGEKMEVKRVDLEHKKYGNGFVVLEAGGEVGVLT